MERQSRQAITGLQRERTDLAWDRTAAAMIVAGALLIRLGAIAGGGIAFLPGLLFAGLGLLFLARSSRRYLGIHAEEPIGKRPIYTVVGSAMLFGIVAMVMVAIVSTPPA